MPLRFFNFASNSADAELLDRFAATDDACVERGDYPVSNMFAVLRHRAVQRGRFSIRSVRNGTSR